MPLSKLARAIQRHQRIPNSPALAPKSLIRSEGLRATKELFPIVRCRWKLSNSRCSTCHTGFARTSLQVLPQVETPNVDLKRSGGEGSRTPVLEAVYASFYMLSR